MSLTEIFGEVIHKYTRAQAIDDGFIIDCTEIAKSSGFKVPVGLTRQSWEYCIEYRGRLDEKAKSRIEHTRLIGLMTHTFIEVRKQRDASDVEFFYNLTPDNPQREKGTMIKLNVNIGPGDDLEPVLTISLADALDD